MWYCLPCPGERIVCLEACPLRLPPCWLSTTMASMQTRELLLIKVIFETCPLPCLKLLLSLSHQSHQHHIQPNLASGLEACLCTQEEAGQELVEQRAQPEASTSEAGPPGGSGQPLRGKQGPGGKRKSGKDVTAADVVAKHEAKAAKDKQEGQQWFDLKQNTSVYVSNLPTDVTEAEIAEVSCLASALSCPAAGVVLSADARHLPSCRVLIGQQRLFAWALAALWSTWRLVTGAAPGMHPLCCLHIACPQDTAESQHAAIQRPRSMCRACHAPKTTGSDPVPVSCRRSAERPPWPH